jgi:hypothetical protein
MIYYHVDVSRVPILSDASLVLASFSDSLLRITFSDTLFFSALRSASARESASSQARANRCYRHVRAAVSVERTNFEAVGKGDFFRGYPQS